MFKVTIIAMFITIINVIILSCGKSVSQDFTQPPVDSSNSSTTGNTSVPSPSCMPSPSPTVTPKPSATPSSTPKPSPTPSVTPKPSPTPTNCPKPVECDRDRCHKDYDRHHDHCKHH